MLKKTRSANNIQYFTLVPLEQMNMVVHAFSASLKMDPLLSKGGYEVEANRHLLCESLGIHPTALVVGRQVHGNKVAHVRKKERMTADAFITEQPGLALAVLTADCLPIVIIDNKRPSVGIVHAGRQGTLRRIAAKAVTLMAELFKTDPQNYLIGIGPGIGTCCYEIRVDLVPPFQESFAYWEEFLSEKKDDLFTLDLIRANQLQLIEQGVQGKNIFTFDLCTCCNPQLFYSYRREKRESRRQLNLVMLCNL